MNLKTISLLSCILCICFIIFQFINLWNYLALVKTDYFDNLFFLDKIIQILFYCCVSLFFYSFYKKLN